MVDNYYDPNPEIPGGHTFLKSGIKNQSERSRKGKNIVLLGTAVDGPVMEPIQIYDYEDGEDIFGPYYDRDTETLNGATLTKALKRLQDDEEHSPDNIKLMRVTGSRAEASIPLYSQKRKEVVNEHIYVGQALGSIETKLDLEIPSGAHQFDQINFDDASIEVLSVEANGTPVRADDMLIDRDNGYVILEEGATSGEATVIVDYNLVHIRYLDINGEILKKSEEGLEFSFANQNLLSDGLVVEVVNETGTTIELQEGTDFDIKLREGILNVTADFFDPQSEDIKVSYTYIDTLKDSREFLDKADGEKQYVYLDHTANSSDPLAVIVDNQALDSDLYSVNYASEETTIVNIKPGAIKQGKEIYVNYHWDKESETKEYIDIRSIYGGSIYNDVVIEVSDNLTMRKNRYERTEEFDPAVSMQKVPDRQYRFLFPNGERSIIEGSVELEVEESADITRPLSEDEFVLNAQRGYVTIGEDFFEPTEETLLVKRYAYKDSEEELVTTVKGAYNAETNSFEGELLSRDDHETVELRHKYLVPGSLDVVVVKDGDKVEVEENVDYFVDYAKGVLTFAPTSSAYPLEVKDKIRAREYQHYNVNSKTIKIKKPTEKSFGSAKELTFEIGDKVNTISELLTAINQNSNNNVIQTRIPENMYSANAMDLETPDVKLDDVGDINTLNKTVIRLRHGDDGINVTKEELYDALGGVKDASGNTIVVGAYEILQEIEDSRYVVPLGVYADDELSGNRSFAQQLANFSARAFLSNNDMFGIIGTKPLIQPTQLEKLNMVNELENLNTDFYLENEQGNGYVTDRKGNRIDAGRYIGIVQYDLRVYDEIIGMPLVESGAVNAAGIASMLSRTNSLTNETIGLGEIAYRLSSNQQSRLLANKLMPAKVSRGKAKIVDGRTCALPDSGWETFQTIHIAYNTTENINRVIDRYIGNGNSLAKQNSLENEIDEELKKDPALVNYDFDMKMNSNDRQIGRMIIPLELVPIGEFRKIYTIVSRNEAI